MYAFLFGSPKDELTTIQLLRDLGDLLRERKYGLPNPDVELGMPGFTVVDKENRHVTDMLGLPDKPTVHAQKIMNQLWPNLAGSTTELAKTTLKCSEEKLERALIMEKLNQILKHWYKPNSPNSFKF